ncbi:hypothetical protein [Falsiroseomonas stagni]|uniref:Histidine kinase n=1 Tax=Falsiroseomonas stagni DSM 19981 TaxID=1123062 RepID=A0A1I4EX30_9PROT|nr:hypothetical protein [Falsiroseomonas stagni]SFL09763.1 hypothetical protein SAMN02745775_11961 [Falsiroseomonas stagni DSM 19981]
MKDAPKARPSTSRRTLDIHRLSQHLAIMSLAAELAEIAVRRQDSEEALLRLDVVLKEIDQLRAWTEALRGGGLR